MSVLNKISQEERENLINITKQKIIFSNRKYRRNNRIILPPVKSANGLAEYILHEYSRIVSKNRYFSENIDLYSIHTYIQVEDEEEEEEWYRFTETFGNINRRNTGGLCVFKELKEKLISLFLDNVYDDDGDPIYIPIENIVYVNFSVRFPLNTDLKLSRDDHSHSWEDGNFLPNIFFGHTPLGENHNVFDNEEPINSIETFPESICIICTEKEPNILFCHCGHIPICEECNLIYKKKKCPICKTKSKIKRKI